MFQLYGTSKYRLEQRLLIPAILSILLSVISYVSFAFNAVRQEIFMTSEFSSVAGLFIEPLFRLEPCEGKLSCTVLRRANGSNVIRLSDQYHRFIKRLCRPMLGFKNFWCAQATLAGIELVRMLKKRQMKKMAGDCTSPAVLFYALAG